MKRVVLCVFCFVLAVGSGRAIDFTLSDSSMVWSNQQWLGMSISDIAVEGGVDLNLYVDIDGNGRVGGDDFLLTVFEVDDGEQNPFGAQTFVDDKDGAANGAIDTAVPMFGVSYNVLQTIGTYVWEAVEVDENDDPIGTAIAAFEVTQPTGTVWVSGQVRDYITQSDPVPGAHVQMEYYSDTVGLPPQAWADANGEFVLYLPDGVSTNDIAFVEAVAKGMMSVEYHPDTFDPISGHAVTQALAAGENVLPDLYVVPEHQPFDLYTVQGTVYRVEQWGAGYETNVLSGVMVICELEDDEDDGPEVISLDITDANGQFSLVIPGDAEAPERELWCESPQLNLRGIVGSSVSVEVTGTVSGVEIYLHNAKAMVRGRVTAQESGAPLTGVEIFFDAQANHYTSSAFTLTNGTYEAGLMPGTYRGECEYDSLTPQGYLSPPGTNGLAVSEGAVVSNISFVAQRGYLIAGVVSDTANNPLTGGYIGLLQSSEWGPYWVGDADVRFDGYYELLSPTGSVYVKTQEFGDYYVDLYHSNQPLCAISDANPIEVTTNGVSGIDFNLPVGARVEGSVWYNGAAPAEWRRIDAMVRNELNEWVCIGGGNTEWGGTFGFAVPAGGNVYLRTEVDHGWMAPRTWYGNTCSGDLATPLSLSEETTISNLHIAVSSGCIAHGQVQEQTSLTPLAGAGVTAFDSQSNRYDTAYTDGTGNYALLIPVNTPLAVYAATEGFAGEFFQDTYDPLAAQPVEGEAASNAYYVPFTLHATSTDSDNDGLADYLEDSVPDGVYNPGDDYSHPNIKDTDDDGMNDGDEYIAGTAAQDPFSLFQITDLAAEAGEISWASVAGRHYTVKFTEDLVNGGWSNIYSVTASGPLTSFTNALPAESGYLLIELSFD